MKIRIFSNEGRFMAKFCLNLHNLLFTILLFVLIHGTQEIMARGPNLDFLELDIYKQFLGNWSTFHTRDPKYDSWGEEVNRTYGVFKNMRKRADEEKEMDLEDKERWKRYEREQQRLDKLQSDEYREQYHGYDKYIHKKRDDTTSGSNLDKEAFIFLGIAILICLVGCCVHICCETDACRPDVNPILPNPIPITNRTPSPYRPPMESIPSRLSPVLFPVVESTPFIQNPIPFTNRSPSPYRPPMESIPTRLSPVRDHERPSAPPPSLLSVDDERQHDLPPSYEEVTSSPARNQKISGPSW